MPFITDTPNNDTNPIAAEMLKSRPEKYSASTPPPTANGMPASAKQAVAQRIEQAVEQHDDQQQLMGTMISRRALACCSSSNSPAHTMR